MVLYSPLTMMKRASGFFAFAVLGVVLFGAGGCDKKAFNESFCASYQQSYTKSCVETCTKAGRPVDACSSGCAAALAKDGTYTGRCAGVGAAPAASTH